VSDWISCEERMPKPWEDVFCWIAKGPPDSGKWPGAWVGYANNDGKWWLNFGRYERYCITHWMAIAPPKERRGE
jgi:hypothetical protein